MAKSILASRKPERTFEGLAAAPGIAFGRAHVRIGGIADVENYIVAKSKIPAELRRFDVAVRLARRQIKVLRDSADKMGRTGGREILFLFDAYLAMLDNSRLVRGSRDAIEADRLNAEAAVQQQYTEIARQFSQIEDACIAARIDDIREVASRLIGILTRQPDSVQFTVPAGSVLVASEISPADMAQIDPENVRAVVAALGGVEGHTAIMARAQGLPAVLGVHGLIGSIETGSEIIVDGSQGIVIVDPLPDTVKLYEKQRTQVRRRAKALDRLRDKPAVTLDGVGVNLLANVELPVEMDLMHQSGARGIGLLRSEFMFMNRKDIPSEDEQVDTLKQIMSTVGNDPVTIRTLDIGGEKPAAALMHDLDEGAASALGLRGIRLSLANPDILKTQFRAILRAAQGRNVRILLPMVSTVSEVRRARRILSDAATSLRRAKVKVKEPLPPLGAMIEIPAAALAADALAQTCDFFAIGSNDLTMYTLAVDRANEHVAALYTGLHPAVLRLIQFSTEAALRARIPVSICGEMAGDPRLTALLVGLGLRDLSMSAANVPLVKQRILKLDTLAARNRALQIMEQTDLGRIAALIDDFNGLA
jgi:phosphotransferase system enzyme I (PtsI)